ncbi:hypothetical protein JVT61DRAFT_4741 [Boletus reticuloceps]|uniref:Uncharacterized protein n=1 Tax=Boletus reticuloceps TaxID=495285 RepID=A0A8I2YMY2_9AGAM|nr:hypothetical protein JVT61DRAFT_4741 [Boletus reticuloceps]
MLSIATHRVSATIAARAALVRAYTSSSREGSVAQSREFGKKERAHEDQYVRRHEAELLRKLKTQIEEKKKELALTALKHKARDQSTASYLLDLQSCFPVATKNNGDQDWRTYALELEEQLAVLKAQRDADQELLSRLPTDASQAALTSDAPPPKKKSKKNPTKDQHDPEWSWDQSRVDWSHFLSSQYPSPPSLIAAHSSLKGALAAPNTDPLSYASRLTDAILRTLETAYHFLFSAPNPSLDSHIQIPLGAPVQLQPEHIDSTRMALVSPLLMYVLRTALHTLVRTVQDSTKSKRPRQRPHTTALATTDAHVNVDRVLDGLLECVLLPLLRAIVPLCSTRLAPLVSASLKKDKDKTGRNVGKGKDKDKDKRTGSSTSLDPPRKTDIRTDVFALIGASLEALDALPPPDPGASRGSGDTSIARDIRDRLGLETIRELEALYALPSQPPPLAAPPSSHQPSSQQPQPLTAMQSEPPRSTPTPTPTPTSLSAPSQPQPQPQPLSQSQSQSQPQLRLGTHTKHRATPESRAKRLERLAGTRAERVRALATRDAGWFLASTLHLCVTPTPPVHVQSQDARRTESSGDLLKEALLDRIGKLIRSVNFDEAFSDSTRTAIDRATPVRASTIQPTRPIPNSPSTPFVKTCCWPPVNMP